jgi:hypothetical protein
MGLNKGKHIVEPINDVRCTVVEKNITKERADFLKKLLEHNSYKVQVAVLPQETPGSSETYVLGVTDILFNPVIDVYQRRLISFSGHKVTPAYWLQISDKETEAEVNYFTFKSGKVN